VFEVVVGAFDVVSVGSIEAEVEEFDEENSRPWDLVNFASQEIVGSRLFVGRTIELRWDAVVDSETVAGYLEESQIVRVVVGVVGVVAGDVVGRVAGSVPLEVASDWSRVDFDLVVVQIVLAAPSVPVA
jgi:hypothetical protein